MTVHRHLRPRTLFHTSIFLAVFGIIIFIGQPAFAAGPNAPFNFAAVSENESSITWSWEHDIGPPSVYFRLYNSWDMALVLDCISALSVVDNFLNENSMYERCVTAVNGGGESGTSGSAYAITRIHDPLDCEFVVTPLPYGRIEMSLPVPPNDNEGDTASYFRCVSGQAWGGKDSVWMCGSYTYVDDGLTPDKIFRYEAKYRNQMGVETSYTNFIQVRSLMNPAAGLNISDIWETGFYMEWDPNGNPTGANYEIWMSTDNVSYYYCDTVTYSGPPPFYANSSMMPGTTYYLRILAINSDGCATEMDSGPYWIEKFPSNRPPKQDLSTMVYVASTDNCVLFGGGAYDQYTWNWDGNEWSDRWAGNPPSGRMYPAMAYNPDEDVIILFSGYDGSSHDDTYSYHFIEGPNEFFWDQLFPDSRPSLRYNHAMVYDMDNGVIVLFGGYDSTPRDDTWIWDSSDWQQVFPPTIPPPRMKHMMAYDASRGVAVMFGGQNSSDDLNDTWEWNGNDWTEKACATPPPPRDCGGIAYDSARERIVLYGGYRYISGNDTHIFYEDVWEYDGADWLQVSAFSPPGCRAGIAFAYDEEHNEFVLFGGMHVQNGTMDDTWTMKYPDSPVVYIPYVTAPGNLQNDWQTPDAIAWSWTDLSGSEAGFELLDPETGQLIEDLAAPDQSNTLEMDLEENTRYRRVVRCYTAGKFEFSDNSNEVEAVTLIFDPYDDNVSIIPLRGGRVKLEIDPIPHRKEGLSGSYFEIMSGGGGGDSSGWLCGSFTYIDDGLAPNMWFSYKAMYRGIEGFTTGYNPNPVGTYTRCNPPGNPNPWFSAAEEGRLQIVWGSNGNPGGTTYYIEMGLTPETLSLVAVTTDLYYDNTSLWPDSTYFYRVSAQNMDGLFDATVFGTDWRQRSPTTFPWPLRDAMMAYDSNRGVVVLFGGYAGFPMYNYINQTWEWDGSNWTQRSPSTPPPEMSASAMVFDSKRNVCVLFGGLSFSSSIDSTWEYNGTSWTLRNPATKPSKRMNHRMAYDSERGVVVMFGGIDSGGGGSLSDTWEWDGNNWEENTSGPVPESRHSHAMAYHEEAGKVVMYGGYHVDGASGRLDDTWEYNGSSWSQRWPTSYPPARSWHAMVYNSDNGAIIIFGGETGSYTNDIWMYDYNMNNWEQRWPSNNPSARTWHMTAYDRQRREMVLFGGNDGSDKNDTWTYSPVDLKTGWTTPFMAPSNLWVPEVSGGTITWTWDENSQAEQGYQLLDFNTSSVAVDDIAPNTTYHIETGLGENNAYWRSVRAFSGNKTIFSGNAFDLWCRSGIFDPGAGDWGFTSVSDTSVELWCRMPNNPFDFGTGAEYLRNDDYWLGWTTSYDSFVDGTLTPNSTYKYCLHYSNADSWPTDWSDNKTIITLCSKPMSLVVNQTGTGWIELGWDPNFNPAWTDFELEYKKEGQSYTLWDTLQDILDNVTNLLPRTTYYFRVRASNLEGAKTLYSNEVSQQIPDLAPAPPTDLLVNGLTNPGSFVCDCCFDIKFTALYQDNGPPGVQATDFHIQLNNINEFTVSLWDTSKQAMSPIDIGERCQPLTYSGSLIHPGVTYYWRIKFFDSFGNEGDWSLGTSYFNMAEYTQTLPWRGYHLVGIPYDTGTMTPAALFGDDLPSVWIYGYDEVNREWYNPTVLMPGRGYFIWATTPGLRIGLNGQDIGGMGGQTIWLSYTDTGEFDNDGWNLIRNPFAKEISWTSLTLDKCGTTHYRPWNGTQYEWFNRSGPTSSDCGSDTIPPGASFWVHAEGDCASVIIADPGPGPAPLPVPPPVLSWRIPVTVVTGAYKDSATYLSVREGASKQHDSYDVLELRPFATTYIQAYFRHPDWGYYAASYTQDTRPLPGAGESVEWRLTVFTNDADGQVNVSWTVPPECGEDWDFYIRDEQTGDVIDLQIENLYQYAASGPDTREFTVTAVRLNAFQAGDVNRDGEISEEDALLAVRVEHALETLTPEQIGLADVDSDGKVGVQDALIIRKRIKGHLP